MGRTSTQVQRIVGIVSAAKAADPAVTLASVKVIIIIEIYTEIHTAINGPNHSLII